MKKIFFTLIALIALATTAEAQNNSGAQPEKKKFSMQEFQEKQRRFITNHAKLTPEEAEAFFPLYFELQKQKWLINKEAKDKVNEKYGKEHSEEKCLLIINESTEAKIKIAELEKNYINKYLQVIPAKKILSIQRAEERFQKDMLRGMWKQQGRKPQDR